VQILLLMIDNYDSFTYNLYQYFGELGTEVITLRNDQTSIEQIEQLNPDGLIISPGPCSPTEAGISNDTIKYFAPKLPILGVCLGHQCLGESFGGTVIRANEIRHGKTSLIHHNDTGVFKGLPNPFQAIRYHSLIVDKPSLPESLEITAWTEEGLIMGLRHKKYQSEGIQFHPESIMTPNGKDILTNFLSYL
jgi:glutamine amidotransferase of anthranilate synthase or aminodeoxychorismate synthase|tara:strand:+ start:71 stop:646 length:576 start_codon:yes stop_codon:yes gene_type:complete